LVDNLEIKGDKNYFGLDYKGDHNLIELEEKIHEKFNTITVLVGGLFTLHLSDKEYE